MLLRCGTDDGGGPKTNTRRDVDKSHYTRAVCRLKLILRTFKTTAAAATVVLRRHGACVRMQRRKSALGLWEEGGGNGGVVFFSSPNARNFEQMIY